MQISDPFLRTKLRSSFVRPNLVSRKRLKERIAVGLQGSLTLIIAPAGITITISSQTSCRQNFSSRDLSKEQVAKVVVHLPKILGRNKK